MTQETPSKIRSLLRGWRLWLLLSVLAYTLIGFFLLPWILERQIVAFGETRLQRPLTVERVQVNPYTLTLAIEGLSLDEADGRPLAALGEFYVDFQASSLFRRAWTFRQLRLSGPYLNFVRFEDGGNNFRRLAQTLSETAEPEAVQTDQAADEPGLPRLLLMHFILQDGAVDVTDLSRETDFQTHFDSIDLELFSLNTLPEKEAQHSFNLITENGADITWTGQLQTNPFYLSGHLEALGERPRLIWRYIQDDVDFEIADGQVSLALDLEIRAGSDGPRIAVDNVEYTLTDLLLRPKGVEQDVLRVSRITLAGGQIRYPEQTIHLEQATMSGARLVAFRDENGVVNIVDLLDSRDGVAGTVAPESPSPAAEAAHSLPQAADAASSDENIETQGQAGAPEPSSPASADALPETETTESGREAEAPASAGDTPSGWRFTLGNLAVEDFAAEFEDRSFNRPVKTGVENLNLNVTDFSTDPGTTFHLRVDTGVTTGGQVAAEGDIGLEPQTAVFTVDVDGLSLDPLEPLIGESTRLRLLSGDLSVDGSVSHGADETLKFSGASVIEELVTEDTLLNERFVAWKRLSVPSIEFALDAGTLVIDTVEFNAPYWKLTVKPDGTTNISDVFPQPAPSPGQQDAAPPVAPAHDGPPIKVSIGSVTLDEGSANFADMSLPLPFATAIHSMKGEIGNISSQRGQKAAVNIAGVVDESGSADIRGELDPFAPTDFLKMDVAFKHLHMPRLTPYSAKFAGREIKSGKLGLDLQYRIEQGKLDSKNNFVIDQLTLGKKVESPEAMNLPLDLAVALLQDSNGRIDLDLPVTGDLNDPEFHYGSVVWKAFTSILVKAVTAPFKLLGALIPGGGKGEQLEFIEFEPGSATLSEAETAELNTIAEALAKRPQLLLQVPAAYSATTDKEAIQGARLEEKVQTRLPGIDAPEGVSAERVALEQIYIEEFSKTELENLQAANTRARDEAGAKPELDEDAYMASLTRSLRSEEVVETAELASLAEARAQAITDYLVNTAGANPGQISTSEISTVEPTAEGQVQLKFSVDTGGAAPSAPSEGVSAGKAAGPAGG